MHNGETPRTLHLCNLANVAYGYCKILSGADADVQLRCHDLLHLMSQPEWDDLELNARDFPEENNFFNNTADLAGYTRPEWFRTPGVLEVFEDLNAPEPATPDPRPLPARRSALSRLVRATLPAPIKDYIKPHWLRGRLVASAIRSGEPASSRLDTFESISARFDELIEHAASFGPEWEISREELAVYHPHAYWLARQQSAQQTVIAYVLTPIYAMLFGRLPYVAVEIGTMRDIPFDGTATGRLLALAYRRADHVIITNPDVIDSARRLGLERYSFVPHPLDEDIYAPDDDGSFRRELEQEYDADFLLFAPARQNWEIKGNDRYLRALAELRRRGLRAALIIPGWGQEVDRSRAYANELGVGADVHWIEPQSEKKLVKYFSAADFVLDQFILGVFGLTTPKALSCGAIALTSYDPDVNSWCFDEHPPLIACSTAEEITEAVWGLAKNPDRRHRISAASREWVMRHHSKAVIKDSLLEAVASARRTREAQPVGGGA